MRPRPSRRRRRGDGVVGVLITCVIVLRVLRSRRAGRAAGLSHAQLLLLACKARSRTGTVAPAPNFAALPRRARAGRRIRSARDRCPAAAAFSQHTHCPVIACTTQVRAHESRNEAPAPPRRAEQRCSPAHRGPGLPAGRRARAAPPGAEEKKSQQEGAQARQGEDRRQTSAGQRQPRRLEKGRRPQEWAALIGSPVLVTIVTTLHSLSSSRARTRARSRRRRCRRAARGRRRPPSTRRRLAFDDEARGGPASRGRGAAAPRGAARANNA